MAPRRKIAAMACRIVKCVIHPDCGDNVGDGSHTRHGRIPDLERKDRRRRSTVYEHAKWVRVGKGTSPRRRWGSRNIPRALGRQPDVGGMVKCSAVEMSKPQSTKRLRLALDGRGG